MTQADSFEQGGIVSEAEILTEPENTCGHKRSVTDLVGKAKLVICNLKGKYTLDYPQTCPQICG